MNRNYIEYTFTIDTELPSDADLALIYNCHRVPAPNNEPAN